MIGVFDSGVGGLSVLRELRLSLPHAQLHYVADTAYMPYGDRTLDEVRERAVCISRYLIDNGARVIVVACNTASAAALHTLRITFTTTQFVGMEPAVKPAAQATQSRVIGVLATRATFQGELFASVVERFASDVRVIAQPCTGLADAIERGEFDSPGTHRMLRRWLLPMVEQSVDTIVLACTHYAFVRDQIQAICGAQVNVIDPAPAIARQTARLADATLAGAHAQIVCSVTGHAQRFAATARRLGFENLSVQHVTIEPSS